MRALITGASAGIGREMARALAAKGYDLILVARRQERLQLLAAELPVQCEIICADLSEEKAAFALYEQVKEKEIDVLVNNAGFGLFGAFAQTTLETELQMLRVNVQTVHILTKLFLRDFCAKDRGYILNVASAAGFMSGPLMATYYATKNYVLRLTQGIRQELRESGSHVCLSALCPGPVDTEFTSVAQVRFGMHSMSARDVAQCAVEGLFQNKGVIVPGMTMKALLFARRFAPEALVAKISYHLQKAKNE